MSLFKFQLKCYVKNGILFLFALANILVLIISLALNTGADSTTISQTRQCISNYAIIYCEFSFLMYIPAVMLVGFVRDKESKTLSFYLNNNIRILDLYLVRSILSVVISITCSFFTLFFYILICHVHIGVQELYIIVYFALIQIYSILILTCISLYFKTMTVAMMAGVIIWIAIQILGLIGNKISLLKGRMSLIDGNSKYGDLIARYTQGIFNTAQQFGECIIIGVVWISIFALAGMLLAKKMKKNNYL